MRTWLSQYIEAQHKALDSVPLDAVERLVETVRKAWAEDRQIFVIGNGGNAASGSHFATDLGKGACGFYMGTANACSGGFTALLTYSVTNWPW